MRRVVVTDGLVSLDPVQMLVASVLRQALVDARSQGPAADEARRWFQDRAAVQWWLDMGELPAGTYARLLAAVEGS